MTSMEITQEMRARLIRAKDQEEVRAILGPEAAEDEIEQIWREIEAHRPADGLEAVDDDELEVVAGGQDYGKDGCSSTTKYEWCWADDHCDVLITTYTNYDPCPNGQNHDWLQITMAYDINRKKYRIFECRKCKARKTEYDEKQAYHASL